MQLLHEGWVWGLVAGLFILGAIAVLASEVVISNRLIRKNDNDHVAMHVRALFGLVKYNIEIPIVRYKGTNVEVKEEQTDNLPLGDHRNEQTRNIGVDYVTEKLHQVQTLLQYTDHLTVWLRRTMSHVKISQWQWKTSVGTGDAVWTAMATGFFWSAQTSLIGVVSQLMRLQEAPNNQVLPLYNQTFFSTEWSCIAKLRFGYVMLAGVYLIIRILKVKGGLQAWQSVIFKKPAI